MTVSDQMRDDVVAYAIRIEDMSGPDELEWTDSRLTYSGYNGQIISVDIKVNPGIWVSCYDYTVTGYEVGERWQTHIVKPEAPWLEHLGERIQDQFEAHFFRGDSR